MNLNNISIIPLKNISATGGNVMHAIKKTDKGFEGFGEIYFSYINYNSVKAWKKHTKMTMNLVVPIGKVLFVFYSSSNNLFRTEEIGVNRYMRITVPPNIWFGFKGLFQPYSLITNIASIPHNPNEVENCSKDKIKFNWQ